ncbi:PREDICTED: uncharacterized protein LOC109396706 [Hipposideros armiger]|uniref:Uncharacterized protein LOC109396706 n=1 Tax=Hipposideros armiger TaxID=186990 RepID=A0A8B7TEY1_HIPAR|nr:PREDICTED: uncharacterized protein LOC109396706 [Hipposideros armiger]
MQKLEKWKESGEQKIQRARGAPSARPGGGGGGSGRAGSATWGGSGEPGRRPPGWPARPGDLGGIPGFRVKWGDEDLSGAGSSRPRKPHGGPAQEAFNKMQLSVSIAHLFTAVWGCSAT